MQHRQRGISFIGFIMVLAIAGFFLFLGMRIGPTYLEYFTIRNAVTTVANESASTDPGVVREAVRRQMQIDYSGNFRPEFVRVQRDSSGATIVLKYEIRKPLIYNLDFVARFEHTAPIRATGGGGT
jgi:hypothetical protein